MKRNRFSCRYCCAKAKHGCSKWGAWAGRARTQDAAVAGQLPVQVVFLLLLLVVVVADQVRRVRRRKVQRALRVQCLGGPAAWLVPVLQTWNSSCSQVPFLVTHNSRIVMTGHEQLPVNVPWGTTCEEQGFVRVCFMHMRLTSQDDT